MKKIISVVMLLVCFSLFLTACGDKSDSSSSKTISSSSSLASSSSADADSSSETEKAEDVELFVHAAASMTEAMNEIAEKYKEIAPNVTLTYNFAASGALQTQIEEGAPADVFISAAQKQMNTLADESLIDTDSRFDLLENKVVLIVPQSSTLDIKSFEDCASDKVSLIALGNPESVPVGQYAQEIFTNLNMWDTISAKSNLAADVKEVLSWVETGNVDCGIVYATDAATTDKVKIICEAPADSHSPVIYPAAILKASEHPDAAKDFMEYIESDDCAEIFTNHGFTAK